MANRTLARADDAVTTIGPDGEPHRFGMWDEITIERSAAGAPGLLFVMTRYENDRTFDQMCVSAPDGAAFLAPVIAWLSGNDPQPLVNEEGARYSLEWGEVSWGTGYRRFDPRPGYSQNREDYA